MARLMNLLGGHSKEDKEILSTLNMLDRNQVPVRIEIENSPIRFNSRLNVRSATVVIAKPLSLNKGLSKGGTVRFKVPNSEGREIRLEIITPHFNLSNGNPVFLCKVPTAYAASNLRGALRFNTSKFTNVQLMVEGHPESFRIVDLSSTGCKFYLTNKEAKKLFPIGNQLASCTISLGSKVSVKLDSLVPRNLRGQSVGCEIQVAKQGPSQKYLMHLLSSLEKTESDQYKT